GAEKLRAYCKANQIFMPTEGSMPIVMQRQIANLLLRAGIKHIEVAHEYDEEGVAMEVSTLVIDGPWNFANFRLKPMRIYAEDRSLLVVVDWDSFFTLICGSRQVLDRSMMESQFEGFFCSAGTRHNWWKQDA